MLENIKEILRTKHAEIENTIQNINDEITFLKSENEDNNQEIRDCRKDLIKIKEANAEIEEWFKAHGEDFILEVEDNVSRVYRTRYDCTNVQREAA